MKRSMFILTLAACFGLPALAAAPSSDDQRFVDQAGTAGATEVEAAKLALKQSTDADVQAFAKQMIADHTKLAKQLAGTAKAQGAAPPPTTPDGATILKLRTLKGAQFDQVFIQDVAVKGHQQAAELFDQESKQGSNADLRKLAADALPTIRHHLDMASKLASSKQVTTP